MLVGDFNQVPCRAFRNSVYELTAGDLLLRKLLRFDCSCCEAPVLGGKSRLIGEGPRAQAFGGWTRFDGNSGTSCIDFGVEVGGRVEDKWRETERERPPRGGGGFLSDHVVLMLRRVVVFAEPSILPQRPKGVNFRKGKEGALTRAAFCELVRDIDWKEELRSGVADALGSREQLMADRIVQAAQQARLQVQAEKTRRRLEATAQGQGRESARGLHNSWCKRLRAAVRYRDAGIAIWDCKDPLLFHPDTGLRRARVKDNGSWDGTVRHCRRGRLPGRGG